MLFVGNQLPFDDKLIVDGTERAEHGNVPAGELHIDDTGQSRSGLDSRGAAIDIVWNQPSAGFVGPGAGRRSTVPNRKCIGGVVPVDNVHQRRGMFAEFLAEQHIQCPSGVALAGRWNARIVQQTNRRTRPRPVPGLQLRPTPDRMGGKTVFVVQIAESTKQADLPADHLMGNANVLERLHKSLCGGRNIRIAVPLGLRDRIIGRHACKNRVCAFALVWLPRFFGPVVMRQPLPCPCCHCQARQGGAQRSPERPGSRSRTSPGPRNPALSVAGDDCTPDAMPLSYLWPPSPS